MSIFNSRSLKAKLSKLDQVDKSNQLKLKKIQDVSNIKIDRDQYLKYKHILFNHPAPKTPKQQEEKPTTAFVKVATQETQTQTNDEKENNNNLMNLSKPISLLETEPSVPVASQSEYRKDVYEFPKQMIRKTTQESESEDFSCQTETDFMPENGFFKGSQRVHNNVIIMEEMNPNLSFSSCPMSDFKPHPVRDSPGDHQNRVFGSGQKSEKKTRLIEYGGESVEISETDSEDNEEETPKENSKKLQEEYNMYKKTILYNKKKEMKEKLPTESEDTIREEEDSVQLEYRLLMEQRKALESDISQLKKIQDEASKSFPKKKITEQKQTSPKSPRFTLGQQQQQQILFGGIEERLSEIATLNNYFGSGRKENFSLNENEEYEREENVVKTRRMKEDEWKVSQEFWDTRRRFINDDMNDHSHDEEEISEDRFYQKDSDSYRKQGDEADRKIRIRDLIDQFEANIEEIRNKKGPMEMKRNHMEDESSLSKRSLYMLGSGSKDLVPISEEVSEEM